jgi:hypothetical protein
MAATVCFDTEVPAAAFAHIEYWQALLDRLGTRAAPYEATASDADVAHA